MGVCVGVCVCVCVCLGRVCVRVCGGVGVRARARESERVDKWVCVCGGVVRLVVQAVILNKNNWVFKIKI